MNSERRHRKRDQTIEEILVAARAIMREEGAAALSMQELARRLDMKAPSLYNYFSGKHDIYDALFRRGFEEFDAFLLEQLGGAESWRDELDRYLTAYMAFALKNPELYQLCFERPVPGFTPSQASLEVSFGALKRGYDRIARWRKELKTDLSNEQVADLIIAISHGLTALHLANEPTLPVGQGRFGGLISAAVSVLETSLSAAKRREGVSS